MQSIFWTNMITKETSAGRVSSHMAGQNRRLKWNIGQILSPDSGTAILQTWLEKSGGCRAIHIFYHPMIDWFRIAWWESWPDKKKEYERGTGKGKGKGKSTSTSSSSSGSNAKGKGKGKHPAWDPDTKYKLWYDVEVHPMESLPHRNHKLAESMWELTGMHRWLPLTHAGDRNEMLNTFLGAVAPKNTPKAQ